MPISLPTTIIVAEWAPQPGEGPQFDVRSLYVELVYTSVVGPTAMLLLRSLALRLTGPDPVAIDTAELAASLGLGRGASMLGHAFGRLARFRLAQWTDTGFLVRVTVSAVYSEMLVRLPASVRAAHHAFGPGPRGAIARESRPAGEGTR